MNVVRRLAWNVAIAKANGRGGCKRILLSPAQLEVRRATWAKYGRCAAAWKGKPSWYAISKSDKTTAPELQRFLAERMKAKTIELESSHVSLISHPKEIAELILAAAAKS
jgi:hypothetical protein